MKIFTKLAAMKTWIAIIFCLGSGVAFAQPGKDLASQVPEVPKYTEKIVDSKFGIQLYEPLNMQLRGDSVRLCSGYACQGWVEDHYENGQLLHKGYYLDGQLKVYKNYFPNGKIEREFKAVDAYRASMKLYYPSGTMKSSVNYQDGVAQEWTDYHENGQMSFHEEYHKSLTYHVEKKHFFSDGTIEYSLTLSDKKKLIYDLKEYHKPNVLKSEGKMKFSASINDYIKDGKWLYYNESGSPVREEQYQNGSVVKEKAY
jgi:antitoxin component YwqK of YwqJK toxin-antitoxin module